MEFSGLGGGAFGGSGGAGWLPEEGFAAPTRLSDVGKGKPLTFRWTGWLLDCYEPVRNHEDMTKLQLFHKMKPAKPCFIGMGELSCEYSLV